MRLSKPAGLKSSQNLENCIAISQVETVRKKESASTCATDNWLITVDITDINRNFVVKLQRAYGGYLGTQRRRRTWRPTIRSGELEASTEPEISEWGNPLYNLLNL